MTTAPTPAVSPDTAGRLLAALQLSDSFFPAGGIAFSWGLETLRADGIVRDAADMQRVLRSQLRLRWAPCDRPLLRAALAAVAAGPEALTVVDHRCEAMSLAREWREASRRLGAAQLGVHAALGNAAAADWLARQRAGRVPAHLPVVQAIVAHSQGFDSMTAEAMSAYALAVGIVGAALRMGVCGHLDAQRALAAARLEVSALLAAPAPALDDAWTGGPMLELAVMRHETGSARLFAN